MTNPEGLAAPRGGEWPLPKSVLERLPRPYRLIAEWTAYLPLEETLQLRWLADHRDADMSRPTILVRLTRQGLSRDMTIPVALYYATEGQALAFHSEFAEAISREHWGRLFLMPATCVPVTSADYLSAIQAALQATD